MRVLARIETPAHAGARDQASALVARLPSDLSGIDVEVDCSSMLVGTPSFLDEIVKQILVGRNAQSMSVVAASARAHHLLERSAANRGLSDRLLFVARA
jgi:hypothetical protein